MINPMVSGRWSKLQLRGGRSGRDSKTRGIALSFALWDTF